MSDRRRPNADLTLSEEERWRLAIPLTESVDRTAALRSAIVLRCADGFGNAEVARCLQVHQATVGKWRRRFVEGRLDGLLDRPRSGTPHILSDCSVNAVIFAALAAALTNAPSVSSRTLATQVGMSASSVQRIRKMLATPFPRELVHSLVRDAMDRLGD